MPGAIITKRLPSFEGVAVNSTATLRIPRGFTYHDILLRFGSTGGMALSNITEIRVLANGTVFQRFSATQLDALNRYYGDAAASGAGVAATPDSLWLHFDRQGLRTRPAREITAVGTGPRDPERNPNPIETFTIEVDLGADAGPFMGAIARVSQASAAGVIRKVLQFSHTAGGSGEYQIADFPRRDAILASHHLAANITDLIIEKNNFTIFDRSELENNVILADGDFPRAPQANYVHYDPGESGYGSQILSTADASDLRWRFTMSGGATITSMIEYMGPVSG